MTRTPHLCHAQGCKKAIPERFLMCRKHWRKVPRDLQRNVWRHYVPGQETRKDPSVGWLCAARLAIRAVALKEALERDRAGQQLELL